MLDNWLRPITANFTKELNLSESQLGLRIQRFEEELPSLKETSIAIIGIGDQEANALRRSLYRMSFPFGKMEVADLGNLRKEDNSFFIPLLQELLEGNICPVVISRDEKFIQAQFKAHHAVLPFISFVSVAENIAFHPRQGELKGHYLNPILNGKNQLFHFSTIGCQSHFVEEEVFTELEKRDFDCIRLGKAKSSLQELEPFIRDADLVSFHLNALKSAEAPGVANASPSGFFSEEACQMSRYAGMNDKLTSIGFYGFQYELDEKNQTSQTLAQLVWYFLDGFYNRKSDFPASMDDLMEYIVDFKSHDYQLTFWKSNKTGRWWLQVPAKTRKKQERHRLIPCSYNDYLLASKGDLPNRLLNAFKRFS
jgi:formiminoglutamase